MTLDHRAEETRGGGVFKRLFERIDQPRAALGSGGSDMLGKLFRGKPLEELLIARP